MEGKYKEIRRLIVIQCPNFFRSIDKLKIISDQYKEVFGYDLKSDYEEIENIGKIFRGDNHV